MSPKKKIQLIALNSIIVIINISLFSKAVLGLSLLSGTALTISVAWTDVIVSVFAFFKGNSMILQHKETRLLLSGINSLSDCIPIFQEAIHKGDVFDDNIIKNIEQIKRFKRKHETINDMLLQKFSADEISFQKFNSVLHNVEDAVYVNMRSILNKISAFDVEEYEAIQKRGFKESEISDEKMAIYNEFLIFVSKATQANENILLKLDKMLLEISRYNSLEDGDVQKLPAIIEMDELIKNANLYS
jgi:hypothetical protein